MPYVDERAGFDSIRSLAESGIVDAFKNRLQPRSDSALPTLPKFTYVNNERLFIRRKVLAIDGSNIYERIPGSLPCTEAGLVTLGLVVIDVGKIQTLRALPDSGAVNPRKLRDTEKGHTRGTVLPGMNATTIEGLSPRTWFRQSINRELKLATLGGESFLETLYAISNLNRSINCPNSPCSDDMTVTVSIPKPGKVSTCGSCGEVIWTADCLRIHEQFEDNHPAGECHSRFRDVLEILAMVNAIRYLSTMPEGIKALGKSAAVVMDGPLAAFGTIAYLANAVRKELLRIQELMNQEGENDGLLVMSGVKSGAFVEHAEELDRAPEPDSRIQKSHVWLPDDNYIRKNIVAGTSHNPKPWGELTYFGRPVIFKTASGKRLVLNVAQPETQDTLTNSPSPRVLNHALAIADTLGVGEHEFLPLRRAHATCAIPLKAGTDIIASLA